MSLGQRIRMARLERGLTQAELGGDDYSKSFISQLERDRVRPSVQTLVALAGRLGRPVQELLDGAPPSISLSEANDWASAYLAASKERSAWQKVQPLLAEGPAESVGRDEAAAWAALYRTGGIAQWRLGEVDEALGLLQRGLACSRRAERPPLIAELLLWIGDIYASRSEWSLRASRCWEQAWELERAGKTPFPALLALRLLLRLAELSEMIGDPEEAAHWRAEAARRARGLRDRASMALPLVQTALELQQQDPVTAHAQIRLAIAAAELDELERLASAALQPAMLA